MKPLHRANQIALRSFQQQVVMIAHQAPSMDNHLVPNTNLPQGSNKKIGIPIPLEDLLALIPAAHDMIPSSRIFNSQ